MVAVWSFEGTERTAVPIQPVLDRPFDKLPISLSLSLSRDTSTRVSSVNVTFRSLFPLCAPGIHEFE